MIDTKRAPAQVHLHFSEFEIDVIGIDSKWFLNINGKVFILQISTAKRVFILVMKLNWTNSFKLYFLKLYLALLVS